MESLIFVVDNQSEVCEFVRDCLESVGHVVVTLSGIETECELTGRPSLVISGISGLAESNPFHRLFEPYGLDELPWIILLESDTAEQRRIAADRAADFIVKPFSRDELLAHVRIFLGGAAFRRSTQQNDQPDILIDSWAMRLLVRGTEIPTTALEFRLVEYMARHRGQVFTRDFLLDTVWGDVRFINPRSVDACIRRIREKIEADSNKPRMLKTIRGVGYRWDATAVWQPAPSESCNCPACRTRISAVQRYESNTKHRRVST